MYFAGKKLSEKYESIFDKHHVIHWISRTKDNFPIYWHILKKQNKNIFEEVKTDIIYAHSIFSAKMAMEIGDYPLVYNDHEFWSKILVYNYENKEINYYHKDILEKLRLSITTFNNQMKRNKRKTWIGLELGIATDFLSLVPALSIKMKAFEISNRIFVLLSFPLKNEIEFIIPPKNHDKCLSKDHF